MNLVSVLKGKKNRILKWNFEKTFVLMRCIFQQYSHFYIYFTAYFNDYNVLMSCDLFEYLNIMTRVVICVLYYCNRIRCENFFSAGCALTCECPPSGGHPWNYRHRSSTPGLLIFLGSRSGCARRAFKKACYRLTKWRLMVRKSLHLGEAAHTHTVSPQMGPSFY